MIIGYEGRQNVEIEANLERQILKDKVITKRILGIPQEYGDVVRSKINLKPVRGIVKAIENPKDRFVTESTIEMSFDVV